MHPSNWSDSVKLVFFNLLMNTGLSMDRALCDRNIVANFVDAIFEKDGATSLKKINCIKAVRNCTGLGLKESKDIVEDHETCNFNNIPRDTYVRRSDLLSKIDEWWGEDLIPADVLRRMVDDSGAAVEIDMRALKSRVIDIIIGDDCPS